MGTVRLTTGQLSVWIASSPSKLALCKVIGTLFFEKDWPNSELDHPDHQDFEFSAVVWLLKFGPLALVTELIQGKQVAEILLAAEEDWLVVNIKG
jgi:hypothetical protein